MQLNFEIEQSVGDIGDMPIMFHGADNKARIVSRINDAFWIRECPTPIGYWASIEIGDPLLYERCAQDVNYARLAYESGYNGIYTWDCTAWFDDLRNHEMALLLDSRRPTPRFLEMTLRTDTEIITRLKTQIIIEVEGVVQ